MKLLIILIISFASISEIYACDCRPMEIEVAYKTYDFVFKGKVTSIGSKFVWDKGHWYPLTLKKIQFDISETYKPDGMDGHTVYTQPDGAACGYDFIKGKEYVVFGYPGSTKAAEFGMAIAGKPMVSTCSPTAPIEKTNGAEMSKGRIILDKLEKLGGDS